jgi:type II secretory pathway component PulJ
MIRTLKRRAAFTLYEVLVTLGLTTIFLGIAGELFNANFKVIGKTEVLSRQTAQIDSAVFRLRRDVWSAGQITLNNPNSVDLTDPSGSKVSWQVLSSGAVQRTDAAGHTTTWTLAAPWAFSADDSSLSVSDAKSSGAKSVRLVSQVLLARRSAP